MSATVYGQKSEVSSFLPLQCQAWWQVSLPSGPSVIPFFSFDFVVLNLKWWFTNILYGCRQIRHVVYIYEADFLLLYCGIFCLVIDYAHTVASFICCNLNFVIFRLHAWGDTLEEAFEQCAMAMFGYMTDTGTVEPLRTVEVETQGNCSIHKEKLWHEWTLFFMIWVYCRRKSLRVDSELY